MKRDIEVGLDDPYNDLVAESLRPMKEEEMSWFEPPSANVTEAAAAAGAEEEDLLPTGIAFAATNAVAELDAEGNGEGSSTCCLSSQSSLTRSLMSSLTSSSLNTISTMSRIWVISSWRTSISTMSISRTNSRPTSSSPSASWIVSDSAISLPAVSDKGVEDSMDSTVKDRVGFSEVLEETTESDISWRMTQR